MMNTQGAIANALKTGQVQQARPQQGQPPAEMAALMNDPEFVALAAQFGPQEAMKMMMAKKQGARAGVAQGVAGLQGIGQSEDPRSQLAAAMRAAQA
jgi:hypothetical protein